MRQVLGAGGTEERKAIAKAFLDGIRIEASAGRAMLRWYRLPQTVRVKVVAVGRDELDIAITDEEALPLPRRPLL